MPAEMPPSSDQWRRMRRHIGALRKAAAVRRSVGTPIWDDMMRERCMNCWCDRGDCGCCQGCAEINADIDPSHPGGGYCVM